MFATPSTYDEDFKLELKELRIALHEKLFCELYTAWTKLLSEYVSEIKEYVTPCKLKSLSNIV